MTKNIQAYFKTENDVESARASLQGLRVSNLFIDELPEGEGDSRYIPIIPLGSTSSGISVGTGVADTGAGAGVAGLDAASLNDDDDNHVTHLLEAQVEDEDYEKAQAILAENKGYTNNS